MAKQKIILLFFLFTGIFLNKSSLAQDCEQNVEAAKVLYDYGQLEDVIDTLKGCKNSENESVRLNANRLLAKAYLELGQLDLARESAVIILEIDPLYKPSLINDSKEFVKLMESIPVIPKFSLGASVYTGFNRSIPDVKEVFSIAEQSSKSYTGENSFQMGISSNYRINKHFGIYIEALANSKKYGIDYAMGPIENRAEERLVYLQVPIGVHYSILTSNRVIPYIQLGAYAGYLLSSTSNYYSTHLENLEDFELTNVNSIDRRKRWDYGLQSSLGVYTNMWNGTVSLQCNYNYSFQIIAEPDVRYDYESLASDYFYLDDDVKLHSLSLQIGYQRILNYRIGN